MGQNFRVDTSKGVFFLKQYRNRMNTIIHEIKAAEVYFVQEGLPVIEPMKDRYGREAFWMEGNWYSLFPFVYGQSPKRGAMTHACAKALGKLLAKFHHAGMRFPQRPFQMLRIGNARKFTLEATELVRTLEQKPYRSDLEVRMLEVLAYKAEFIEQTTMRSQDIPLMYNCLLHGDFQYLNTFTDDRGEITHVYDLERSSLGPPAYEVARSLILNCFDDGWENENFALGRTYLCAYREDFPLTRDDLFQAMRLYTYSILHMTWIEARYIVFGVDTQLPLYDRHMNRIQKLATQDLQEFCDRVWE